MFNREFESFAKSISQLLDDLPPPFALPRGWRFDQEDSLILCLRPGSAGGLPLCTLHDVFRTFQCESSVLLSNSTATAEPMPTEMVAAHLAAIRLCHHMGDAFDDVHHRAKAFDACVVDLFGKWEKVLILNLESFTNYGKVNRCFRELNVPIVLREDKWEAGHGKADVYLQITYNYSLLVKALTESTETAAINFLSHGAPCFLICVLGMHFHLLVFAFIVLLLFRAHVIFICGGFYDGQKTIVEPLSNPVFMLRDPTNTRPAEVATLLWALVRGISSLRL